MSQTQFDKAVAIVQALPKDGPIKPTQDDQLTVRLLRTTTARLLR
jgi:hypothetical protein